MFVQALQLLDGSFLYPLGWLVFHIWLFVVLPSQIFKNSESTLIVFRDIFECLADFERPCIAGIIFRFILRFLSLTD